MSGPADWPRERWPEHPRWPQQTLLLSSHESFRGWSGWILERVAALEPDDPARVKHRRRKLARHRDEFDWWMRGMKSHERYEETKLYPYLARRWGAEFADLERGHRELGEAKDGVFGGFDAVVPGDGAEPQQHAELVAALRRHRAVLFAHLELEEDRVIPLLLELLPAEFDDYVTLPAKVLLTR